MQTASFIIWTWFNENNRYTTSASNSVIVTQIKDKTDKLHGLRYVAIANP